MNITKNQKDDLNLSITINVTPEDYTSRVDKVIREYKQKANMPGFRPGKVPTGLIKKMYGKHITAEEINKILSEELSKYITENKINVLGEPLPSESDQKEIDWENDTTFEFSFDLGLSPEFEIKLSEALKIPYYTIEPDKEMISKQIEDYARRLGSYSEVSSIEGDVLVHGNFTEVDESGKPVENGLITEDGSFLTQVIKSEDIKKSLTGLKPEDKVKININEAFPNQADVASMLKTDKNNLSEMSSYFEFMISKISKWQSAEINQELFDKAYGENQVKSEKEFKEKIAEDLKKNMEQDSNYKFSIDAKKKLLETIEVNLPDEFLKRFILLTDKKHGITSENIEEHYPKYQEQFKWELIKNKIIAENKIQITEEEVTDYAKKMVRSQFINYGINYLPDEYLVKYCDDLLKKEDERTKIQINIYEDKAIEFVKSQVKLTNKKVTLDEFNKLFENKE